MSGIGIAAPGQVQMTFIPIGEWGFPMRPLFLLAGPCSAESEEQVLATARELDKTGISCLRAGLWKPRTYPGTFEGVGSDGIPWLLRARERYGLRVGVEVATPEHVEVCLQAGVDLVWIGARTTTNPFSVQALADALRGAEVPVLVKNPMSPDIDLWIGAVERLANAGVRRLGAIHRGFSTSRSAPYRYAPVWRIPIELRRRLPEIPILCDPSHICGRTDLIFAVAQEALDLLYDGLAVEVHNAPREARSDAAQQLTPAEFRDLIGRLKVRRVEGDSKIALERLHELRAEVDGLDHQMIELLADRMGIVRKIGRLKKGHDISALQPRRWEEIVASRIASGREHELDEDFIFHLFEMIHEEAIRQQEQILQD